MRKKSNIFLLLTIALLINILVISSTQQNNNQINWLTGLGSNNEGNVTLDIDEVISFVVHQDTNLENINVNVKSGMSNCSFVTGGHNLKISAHNNTIHLFDPDIIYNNSGRGLNSNIITPSNINAWDTGIVGNKNDGCSNITSGSLKKMFHLIENTGNVDIDITASINKIRYNSINSSLSTCKFITGTHDLDGSDGCQDGGTSTRSDIEVGVSLYPIPVSIEDDYNKHMAAQYHFNYYDKINTTVDYNDTSISVNQTDGGELTYIRDLNTSEQQLAKKMKWASREDELVILFGITIPSDTKPGIRTMEVRYTASQSI